MNKRKRRFGDRKDGRKLRSLDPITQLMPYLMVQRNESNNLFEDKFDADLSAEYIKKKRREGFEKFGFTHILLASYVRTVSQRPGINRFIAGQKTYARNDIVVNITVKKELALNAEETIVRTVFSPTDTVDDVYRKFSENINSAFSEEGSDFDSTAKVISLIPGIIKKLTVKLLKFLDYFGMLPKSLLEVSPFHGSLFITSMGSLGIPPVFHHLYDFGNVPIFLSFGAKETEYSLNKDGKVEKHSYIPYKINCDERICDGHYYSSAFKYMKRHMKNPYLLDEPIENVVEDID